jgi:hypothetical protein
MSVNLEEIKNKHQNIINKYKNSGYRMVKNTSIDLIILNRPIRVYIKNIKYYANDNYKSELKELIYSYVGEMIHLLEVKFGIIISSITINFDY